MDMSVDLPLLMRSVSFGNNRRTTSNCFQSSDGHQSNNTGSGTQHNYYGVSNTPESPVAETFRSEKEECLKSLSFPNIHARKQDIADAHTQTCDWFYETPEFQRWRDNTDLLTHNGVLWIKGKPGAGKSTLMKHTLRHCEKVFHDHLIISYFFNARGEILERTPQGMMQSIVYQLIDGDAALYESFGLIYRKERFLNQKRAWVWRHSLLKEFVLSVIKEQKSKPVLFLIDALDECDEHEARGVVGFLERLSVDAVHFGITLRICLSSRHYPHISITKALEITIEKDKNHRNDIALYVEEHLQIRDYDIEAKINEKANGIFMWVVLVVSLLNKAYDEGQVEAMQELLERVPGDLEHVFSILLENDKDNMETILMLQWVLFSLRPLKAQELFFATLEGTAPEHAGPWDQSKITMEIIRRRITSSSKGLIEIREYDGSAQFIHQSVSDFLHRNRRLQTLDQTLAPDPISASHNRLMSCCWSCIKRIDTTLKDRDDRQKLEESFPFLSYASFCIFGHVEVLLELNNPSARQAVEQWIRDRSDWFPRLISFHDHAYPKNDFSIHHRTGNTDAAILQLPACEGCEMLTRLMLEMGLNVNAQGGIFNNALQAVSYTGDEPISRLLLEKGANINLQGGIYGHALQAASCEGHYNIVRLLLEKGADINLQGGIYGNSLQAASCQGHYNIVRLLLEKGADVNLQGGMYSAVSKTALHEGFNNTVSLLLKEADGYAHVQGSVYINALQAALCKGYYDIARLLLEKGADPNIQGGIYGSALQAAIVNECDIYDSAPQTAIVNECNDIVRILLEKGADPNIQGGIYGNSLYAASLRGRSEIVEMLLEKGAGINAENGMHGHPLYIAIAEGHDDIAELLLEKTSDLNMHMGSERRDEAPRLFSRIFVSLSRPRLLSRIAFALTSCLMLHLTKRQHTKLLGSWLFGVVTLGVKAWETCSALLSSRGPFGP